ncbi:ABC transporter permease [Streptomyces olivaceus]|uniref:ABC transporter permease n=1 Tax=Streptomyces TaxID=1883 RepID=UPI001CCF98C7|nr:ABC transporter permease [Streptomyces olivaceus]MBZ6227577.1 ABC transporter permease [Streptomyces olivaceus]
MTTHTDSVQPPGGGRGAGPAAPEADQVQVLRPQDTGARRLRVRDLPGWLLSSLLFVLLLGLWEGIVRGAEVSPIIVPPPSDVFVALWDGLTDGELIHHTWITLQEILGGFLLAVVFALSTALLVTQSKIAEKSVLPLVVVVQSVPKVAMAPMLLIWFGFGMTSKTLTTALIAFFPLLINAILGLNSAGADEQNMLRTFGASRWQVLRRLRIPAAVPHIIAGLDSAAVLSVLGAIVAEFVGAQAGLGYVIQASNTQLDTASMFAVLVILSGIGLGLHFLITGVGRRVAFWSADNDVRIKEV